MDVKLDFGPDLKEEVIIILHLREIYVKEEGWSSQPKRLHPWHLDPSSRYVHHKSSHITP